jgi:hypothetical protein
MELWRRTEMQNETDLEPRHPEICQELTLGERRKVLGRLDLEDDLAVDNPVDALTSDCDAFVEHVHPELSLDMMPATTQLFVQSRTVDRFEQTESHLIVRVVERADDRAGQIIEEEAWSFAHE